MTTPAYDEVIHPSNRLQICAMLGPVDALSFAAVRDALGVSDSVLSKQVKILQDAGYLTVHKEPLNSRVRAWISLTARGREAFTGHLAWLRLLAEQADPAGPAGPAGAA